MGVYTARFKPFTYEEMLAPVQAATLAHQKVEEDYNNNMLVVDSLRQRAMNEPDANWSKQIMDYANNLEAYATDLARNGLTRETRFNLLQAKRGYGTTVVPVVTAMAREKELQNMIDKADPKARMIYGDRPTIDLLIANPNLGLSSYSGAEIHDNAKGLAGSFAARHNVPPQAIDKWMYMTQTGYTDQDINEALKDPNLKGAFDELRLSYGYLDDPTLQPEQKDRISREVFLGMMEGLIGQVKYGNRPDNPGALASLYGLNLQNKINKIKLDALENPDNYAGNGFKHKSYYVENKGYQNNKADLDNLVSKGFFNQDGSINQKYLNSTDVKEVLNEYGINVSTNTDFIDIYDNYIKPAIDYKNGKGPKTVAASITAYYKPKIYNKLTSEQIKEIANKFEELGFTEEIYNNIKNLGYDKLSNRDQSGVSLGNSDLSYYSMLNDLDEKVQKNNVTIIPLTDYNDVETALESGIISAKQNDLKNWYSKIYKVEKNGSIIESLSKNESKALFGEDGKYNSGNIISMGYSMNNPDYIILKVRGIGEIAVPMSMFEDSELYDDAVNSVKRFYNAEALINTPGYYTQEELEQAGTSGLRSINFQDQMAGMIYNHFLNREQPVYGNTISRPK